MEFALANETDILEEYKTACTTRILGLAAEECGRLSYDIDQTFTKEDLMDPEFPCTMADEEEERFVTPEDILTDICGKRVEIVVETIGNMEECWTNYESSVKEEYLQVAQKLWEFVKNEAEFHVQSLYGDEYMEEFAMMGDSLFGRK